MHIHHLWDNSESKYRYKREEIPEVKWDIPTISSLENEQIYYTIGTTSSHVFRAENILTEYISIEIFERDLDKKKKVCGSSKE